MTVLAVILAVLSLSLKWYSLDITYTYEGEVGEHVSTYYLYLSYWEGSGLRSYLYGFEEAGAVIDSAAALILVWAFFSLLYLSALVQGGSGFVRGWLMIMFACLPVAVYMLFMTSAVEAGLSEFLGSGGEVESHPPGGFILLVLAAVLQVVAVLLRNIQVLSPWLSADAQNETV